LVTNWKLVPVINTEVAAGPEVGVNEVIVGANTTVYVLPLVAVPADSRNNQKIFKKIFPLIIKI
jgi:hypothetical protein